MLLRSKSVHEPPRPFWLVRETLSSSSRSQKLTSMVTLRLSGIPVAVVGLQPTLKRRVGRLGARYSAAMLPGMKAITQAITTVWLVKPEAPQDDEGVAAMRLAIEQDGAREGSLVAECLEAARARGLSGEDTYVFIAYQALLRLQGTYARHLQ